MNDTDNNMRDAINPVFAEFGAAMYVCQCFESSLCFLLALMAKHKIPNSFSASWDFHSEKTLGVLVKKLKDELNISEDVESYLMEGVKLRNKIAHGFLTSNVMQLYEHKGRIALIEELNRMKIEVKKRDIMVNKFLDTLLKKYGLSNELLKQNAEYYWRTVNFENTLRKSDELH